MKRILLSCTLVVSSVAGAQVAGGSTPPTSPALVAPSTSLDALLSTTEGQMVSLAKAMPAKDYNFVPTAAIFSSTQSTDFKGVRSFGALVVHVAQVNYGLARVVGGLKPDVDPASLAKLTDKAEIVAALEASFVFVHKSIATLTPSNSFESVRGPMTRATAAAFVVVHASDEYGQMVEYLRMNGVVPPASQK